MNRFAHFEDEFLESLATSFRKRRKSLSHRASSAEYAKVYDNRNGDREERLEIDIDAWKGVKLRLWAWSDRWIWVDARQGTKREGWAWEWTNQGRLSGARSTQNVIEALEATYDQLHGMASDLAHSLDEPWKTLLAQGPKPIE